jgi:TatD DNase family protein
MIDTHCHLYLPEFDADRDEIIARAMRAGVEKFFLPNIDSSSITSMLSLSEKYSEKCYPMMGLHPCSVKENWEDEVLLAEKYLFKRDDLKFWGIGETGLDYYWDRTFVAEQKENFQVHIDWAKQLKLPLIIHSRESTDDCISMVANIKDDHLRGIFHCFSGTIEQALQIIELGFYLGIGGVVTFKNSGLDKVIHQLDLDHVVLETDSPYLAPVPHRGKRNESSYLRLVAERIAAIKNMTTAEVSAITSKNAEDIFHL